MKIVPKETINFQPKPKLPGQNETSFEVNRDRTTMSNVWSGIIFILNIWTLFTCLLWASLHELPTEVFALIHIVIECILFFEVIMRILLRQFLPTIYENFNLHHMGKRDPNILYMILLMGSFPIMTLYAGISVPNEASKTTIDFARILLIKLLRSYEIPRAIGKVEEILFYKRFKTLVLVKFIKNFIILLFVTHIFTCAFLLVQSSITNHAMVNLSASTNSENPFGTALTYFARNGEENAPLIQKYMDACLWAVGTLAACSFGDVTPRTFEEVLLSLITLLTGVVLLAMIFSDFAKLMYLVDIERAQARKQLQKALKLCEILKVPFKIRYKIQSFYDHGNSAFSQTQYLPSVRELPKSLHTDIVLSINKDVISKINVFNYGSPDLLIEASRMFYPKVSMAGDFVLRAGDDAEEMFFIKQGEVEVLANDNKTRIAILREGAYFGEIGLLLTQKRTVSIRALTVCVFEVLNKEQFTTLLEGHPEQQKLLLQVANQRIKICSPDDIIKEAYPYDSPVEASGIYDTDFNENAKGPKFLQRIKEQNTQINTETSPIPRFWRDIVIRFRKYACINKDSDFRNLPQLLILPASKFYYIWTVIVGAIVFANLLIIPYEISFGLKYTSFPVYWQVIDVIVAVLQFVDIFVHMNTSIKKKNVYVSNKDYVIQKYFNQSFILDLLAFIPLDYITMALNLSRYYTFWVKITRLAKIPRLISMLLVLREDTEKKNSSFFLIILAICYISFNHIAACVMHMIANNEYNRFSSFPDSDEKTLYQKLANRNTVDMPLTSQDPSVQYIYFIYWAFSVSSSGSFGDVVSVTPFEKFFEIVTVLFFKTYFAFIAAEVASIFTSAYVSFKENLDKKTMYLKWMTHIKLPVMLSKRVIAFNEHVFTKYKGLDENKILAELPSTTRNEIMEFLLADLIETAEIFPKDEIGLFSSIIKGFRFQIVTKNEFVFRAGETAEEIFFILYGEVAIEKEEGHKVFAHLKKNDFFGEISLLEGKVGVRTKCVRAKTDLTLAVLHLTHLKEVWKKYPTVKEKMAKIAEIRQQLNQKNENEIREEQLVDSETVKEHSSGQKADNVSEFDQLRREIEEGDGLDQSPPAARKRNAPIMKESPEFLRSLSGNDPQQTKASAFDNIAKETGERNVWDNSVAKPRPSSRSYLNPRDAGKGKSELFTLSQSEMTAKPRDRDRDSESLNYISDVNNKVGGSYVNFPTPSKGKHETPESHGKLAMIVKAYHKFEERFKIVRPLILNLILFFDVILAPLNIALEVATSGPLVYVELTFASILLFNFLLNLKDLIKNRKNVKKIFPASVALAILNPTPTANKENHHNKEHSSKEHHEGKGHNSHHDHVTLTTVCLDFIFMIPFTVIFHAFHVHGSNTNALLIGIQLVKLFAVEHLTWIFQQEAFKKRYALNNILMILYAFVILNHLVACLFIIMANVKEDVNTTWYAKVPAPQFEFPNNVRTTEEFEEEVDDWTIYIHALYWAYMTTSHIGIGDISAINHDEKIFASIVIMISSFIYAFLFGNLASLVDDLTPKFQKEFENNYRNVLEYAKTSKLDHFLDKIHKYYNYIWQDNKGIDEDEILSTLPNSLRYDIFHARYESVISSSKFFKNQDGSYNSNIFYSFCKKMKYRVFMESDFIVVAGQEVGDVYIILEGEAEVVQYHIDTQNAAKYSPGDHIGGMIPNMVQLQNIKASKITKVAILSQESFLELKEAYPEWYAHIMKSTPLYKLMHHFINTFKQSITESGKKPKVKEINQIKDNLKEMRINSAISKKRMVDDQSRPQGQRKKTDQSYVINDDQANKNAFDSKRRNFRERDSIQNSVNVNEGVKRSTFFKVNPDNSQQGPAIQSDSESHPEDQPIEHKDSNNAWVDLIDPLDPLNSGTTPLAQSREGASFRHSRFRKKETMSDSTVPRVGPPPIMTSPSYLDPQSFNVQKSKSPKPNCFALIMKKMTSLLFKPKDILSRPSLQNDAASDRDLPIRMPSLKKEKSKSPTKLPRKSIFGNLMGRKESSGESEDQNGKDEEKDFELELKGHLSKALSGGTSFRTNTFVPKLAEIIHDTKKLDQHMRALKYYINPNSIWKTIYEMIHTFSIIYSVFAVPLYVGFDLDISDGFVVMEVLIFVELIVYPICLMRTAQYAYGILRLNPMQVWKKFIRKGFVTYLLALLPMNLIFRFGGISIPVWLSGILRINRVLLVTKTSTQFAFFGSKYPQITRMLNVLKPTFYLAFVSHFISCLFSWTLIVEPNTSTEENFTEFLELGKDSLSRRYMIALDFILSIATTTGYPELIVYNNYERLTCIFLVYLGDAVFALILGWYSSNSTALPEKYNYVFERIRKMEYILQAKRIPHKIRTKVENYFAYIVDTRNSNKSCLEALSGLLPPTTLRDMACDQASVFKTLPLLKELNNKVLVKEILQNLKQSIYLPHDYIITRNEYGSEMYCIAEGTVHMLSPNEKKVLAVLQTGAFFGELGVYTTTKRLTSFVADSFCLIYILDKEIFRKIMKSFPQADYDYKQFAQRKFAEGNSATVRANDQLHKAYTNLHALANTAIASSSQPTPDIAKLLRSAEVPRFLLRVPDDRRVSISDQFLLASQRTPREEKVHAQFKEDGEDIPLTSLVDDCIEDEEIDQRGIDLKKNSFRIKTKTRERRFSRLQLGKEKSVSKSQGLTIRWGLNLQ